MFLEGFGQVNELVSIATAYSGDVSIVSYDGTSGRVCWLFELMQERLVHWHVGQLQADEVIVNLTELFQYRDGKTARPKPDRRPTNHSRG